MIKKTTNTYEAAFYMYYGAVVHKIEKRKLSENKRTKKGYRVQYTIYLQDVPAFALKGWSSGIVYGDIQEFARMRQKLKRLMYKI